MPHQNAQGARPAKNPAKTSFQPGRVRNSASTTGFSGALVSRYALRMRYAERMTRPTLQNRWTAIMYGPGSNASKTYLVSSTRIATSAKWVTVNTSANARPEKNPLLRSSTEAARSDLACPGHAAWTNPSPAVSQNSPQNDGAEGSSTNSATPLSTFRKKSAPYTEESRSDTEAWNRDESAIPPRAEVPPPKEPLQEAARMSDEFAHARPPGADEVPGSTAETGSSRYFCPGERSLESGFHPHITSSPSV